MEIVEVGADILAACHEDGQTYQTRAGLSAVLLAMFMAGFDIWVVNVAGPSLQRDLHVRDAAVNALVALTAAALTLLLPRRTAARRPAVTAEPAAEYTTKASVS